MRLITIKTVSGDKYQFRTEYKTIKEWLCGNFKNENAVWWAPVEDSDYIIRIENIDSIKIGD